MEREENNKIENVLGKNGKAVNASNALQVNKNAKEVRDTKETGDVKETGDDKEVKAVKAARDTKENKLTNGKKIIFMDSKEASSGVKLPKTPQHHFEVGDVVKLKKQHPCGSSEWEILRIGSDFHLKCRGCGHMVVMPRRLVEKNLRKLL